MSDIVALVGVDYLDAFGFDTTVLDVADDKSAVVVVADDGDGVVVVVAVVYLQQV